MGPPTKIDRSLLLKILLISLVTSGIVLSVKYFWSAKYAWIAFFFIILNLYLYYRITIRNLILNRTRSDTSHNHEPLVDEKTNTYLERFERTYVTCPHCEKKTLSELDYCEECGGSIPVEE